MGVYGIAVQTLFAFFPPENVSLEFSNATGTETSEGLSVTFPPECTKLEGTLRVQKGDVNICIGLELPVLPCRWSILDAISPDEILPSSVSVHDFIQKSFLLRAQLYGNCVKDSYTVDLCSANGTEQQVPVLFNSRNTTSLALAAFRIRLPIFLCRLFCYYAMQNIRISQFCCCPLPKHRNF